MADNTSNAGGISLKVLSTNDVLKLEEEANAPMYTEEEYEINYDPLVNHIITIFEENRRAKIDSGIEDDIVESLEAYNGVYSKKDLARMAESGGSQIFMNLTSTKARAAKSWISDILKPHKGQPWSLMPTPLEDLPGDIKKTLTAALEKEFSQSLQQGQPQNAEQAGMTTREINERRRSVETAIRDEIHREAMYQLSRMQRRISDQLSEGEWDKALNDFIDDFVVFPCAILKGPIVQNSMRLVWKNGEAVKEKKYKFLNKRVHPLDIYPSPSATCIEDGNLCEHLRFSRAEVEALKGIKGYHDDAIDKILEEDDMGMGSKWVDTSVEQDKAELEGRSSYFEADRGVIHGLHFWGDLKIKDLRQWEFGPKMQELTKFEDNDIVAVEVILVGNHVVKCLLNDDPLKRRPYFKASFMNIPGSFWGKSLPKCMESQQRMCNAVARALSNNLGIASGPQVSVYIDRLADSGPITSVYPFKIWQFKSDPTGGQGKAIDFFQPTSNANELLGVYNDFESKADDVTGIPKYAYGNETSKGMTQTAQGLAMLLETTSKIIKDCIRNIDEGLIKPRIMYQFHYNMLNMGDDFNYTGDINVVTVGSSNLTIEAAEATKRNEFLQATANEFDFETMGKEGRAEILRKMGEDLGVPNFIPTPFEIKQRLKAKEAQAQQAAQQMAEAEKAKAQVGIQATQMQVEGQKEMHAATMEKDIAQIQAKMKEHQDKMAVEIAKLRAKLQESEAKLAVAQQAEANKDKRQTQEVALKIKEGSGI